MDKKLRLVYLGTPEFAVEGLKILVENEYNIVGVITAPDKPSGRGLQLKTSAVKDYAISKNLTLLQPTNLKDPDFLENLKELKADLQIVVAFRMLPEVVWNMPKLGTFNLHASLLPQYRGAAPINWAIINGETETGVSTFFLKHEIDTGDLIFQEKTLIGETETVGELYQRLMKMGAELILKTVQNISNDSVIAISQDQNVVLKHAPKIFKETCQINWNLTAKQIVDLVRGLNPSPSAWCIINEKSYKIHEAKISDDTQSLTVGEYYTNNKDFFKIGCGKNTIIELIVIQPEGKKRMNIKEYLIGNKI